jgi:hypothetical protein
MHTAMLKRMVKRLAALPAVRCCPECADWPTEVAQQIVEEVIEPGEVLPAADPTKRHATEFGPCVACGRLHRARVIPVEDLCER